jgi:hypothetical protein
MAQRSFGLFELYLRELDSTQIGGLSLIKTKSHACGAGITETDLVITLFFGLHYKRLEQAEGDG